MTDEDLPKYASEEARWRAVQNRDEKANGYFYYVVRTTGTYSKPSCVSRSARRENIEFFSTAEQARAAGYRPCGRCRPDEPDLHEIHANAVIAACRIIEESELKPSLQDLARRVGFSQFYFHRVFKAFTGITPQAYFEADRARRLRDELSRAESVSDAIYSSGFNSNGHFYGATSAILGMTPTSFRSGGRGASIRFAVADCSIGPVLVAATDKSVCAVLLSDGKVDLRTRVTELFPQADLAEAGTDSPFAALVAEALRRAELPAPGRELLPVHVQRVVLQQRVGQVLRETTLTATAYGTGRPARHLSPRHGYLSPVRQGISPPPRRNGNANCVS
jgi:AraC family transcriptional regulator of adaptative response/methylated-DNA-[protein]-cysteine methyltransferase